MAGATEQQTRQFAEMFAVMDLTERQMQQVGQIVEARLAAQSAQTQNQIAEVQSRINEASTLVGTMRSNIEGNQNEVNSTKEEIRIFIAGIDKTRDDLENRLKTAFSGHDAHLTAIEAEVTKHRKDKDDIITEIAAKTAEFASLRDGLQTQLARAENVLNEQTGGWKREVQATIQEMRNSMETRNAQVTTAVENVYSKIVGVESQMTAGGKGFGSGNIGMSPTLLDPRDLKMPFFPDKPENVEAFKRWFRGVTSHVSKNVNFPNAGFVFNTIRSWPNPLINPIDIGIMIDSASNSYYDRHG